MQPTVNTDKYSHVCEKYSETSLFLFFIKRAILIGPGGPCGIVGKERGLMINSRAED